MNYQPGDALQFDTTVPNVARIYDYFLGGKDNCAANREAAAKILGLIPDATAACHENRKFLRRVVRYLAEAGIRQFIDISTGLPTRGNVHEIAQKHAPGGVVYVDYDRCKWVVHTCVMPERRSSDPRRIPRVDALT